MIRIWARVPILLVAALALPGSASPLSRSLADVSLTFQDLGPVLTGADVGLAAQGVTFPTAAVLPDGRIRLYYVAGQGANGVYSAISADGIHFAPEPGQRRPFGGYSQIERLPDGRWRLYSASQQGISSAISDDGLNFTVEPGLRVPNPLGGFMSCCGIVRLAEGRYRMYLAARPPGRCPCPPFQTYSAISSDLLNWTMEPGIRGTRGGGPAALLMADGSIMLVFQFGPPSFMRTAVSADGLTFGEWSTTSLDGADPAFVNLPDGRLLMYYTAGDVPTINAAVAILVTAPAVTYPAPAATAIGTTTARVSAIVDPHGADTGYSFDYGTSTAYGDTGDVGTLSAASGKQTVSSALDGLTPATTYHFRVTAENSAGTTEGADESFTTAGCRLAPARDRGWEVALGHAATRPAAAGMLRRASKVARGTALVERDGCTDYEPALAGLTRKAVAAALGKAKRLGFRGATVERT